MRWDSSDEQFFVSGDKSKPFISHSQSEERVGGVSIFKCISVSHMQQNGMKFKYFYIIQNTKGLIKSFILQFLFRFSFCLNI